ncbi:hypothetical protein ACSNOI_15425 [Actinomadura kijaniata]|uniref:hypothetical protein n=1 Tax=Actinomadura kijaniata TaxID=46161 RepID=UPI003F1C49B0
MARVGPVPDAGLLWGLLSRSRSGGWYNAEYLPQLAAYVDAILNLGYPAGRVLFELPSRALQLDLAILDDDARVVVAGEAKRSVPALTALRRRALERYSGAPPGPESKRRGDEARQLAWRLWNVAPRITWLVGPGHREAFLTCLDPLRLQPIPALPHARDLALDHEPPGPLPVPTLL